MDPATLKKLLGRASDCITAAQTSIGTSVPSHANVSIRTAYDILAYIETKQALAGEPGFGPVAKFEVSAHSHHD